MEFFVNIFETANASGETVHCHGEDVHASAADAFDEVVNLEYFAPSMTYVTTLRSNGEKLTFSAARILNASDEAASDADAYEAERSRYRGGSHA